MGLTTEIAKDAAGNVIRNDDGSPHLINTWTPLPGETTISVVQTGPIRGAFTHDGTTYDLTPEHIQVSTKPGHLEAVCAHIEANTPVTLTPLDAPGAPPVTEA